MNVMNGMNMNIFHDSSIGHEIIIVRFVSILAVAKRFVLLPIRAKHRPKGTLSARFQIKALPLR